MSNNGFRLSILRSATVTATAFMHDAKTTARCRCLSYISPNTSTSKSSIFTFLRLTKSTLVCPQVNYLTMLSHLSLSSDKGIYQLTFCKGIIAVFPLGSNVRTQVFE